MTFQWNVVTDKKKGQKWGKEKVANKWTDNGYQKTKWTDFNNQKTTWTVSNYQDLACTECLERWSSQSRTFSRGGIWGKGDSSKQFN